MSRRVIIVFFVSFFLSLRPVYNRLTVVQKQISDENSARTETHDTISRSIEQRKRRKERGGEREDG